MSVVFHDACNTSANYDTISGSGCSVGGNNGMLGTLGASGSIHVTYSTGAYVFEGLQKHLASSATIFQFYVRVSPTFTLGTGITLFGAFTDGLYTGGTAPARLDMFSNASGLFRFRLMNPANSYAAVDGATTFTLGQIVRVVMVQTSAGWSLFLNNQVVAEATFAYTQTTLGISYFNIGTLYNNDGTGGSGIVDFDDIYCGNLNATPTTLAGKIDDAYQGFLQNHLSAEGQPYRGPTDGLKSDYSTPSMDTVSETASYMLKLNVQNNDQTSFIAVDNWILNNLLRSKSTTGNTNNNPAPTVGLSLMCYWFNSANTDGKGIGTIYDANWAGDTDHERAQALLWAHARWGSSSNSVGSDLVAPNYLQRAKNIMDDLRLYAIQNSAGTGYNYLCADGVQFGSATYAMGGDYDNTAAYLLFAQYDKANATFWQNTVLGAYDRLTKMANKIMTGQSVTAYLNPDWAQFTIATAVVGGGTSPPYGTHTYTYNAFRIYSRLLDAFLWYGDKAALGVMQLPKPFFVAQWAANGYIPATFNHDGTSPAAYHNTLFNFPAYFTMWANDQGNTTAAALFAAELSNLYYQRGYGSIISNSGTGEYYAYFDQSWLITNLMQLNGLWINYGQEKKPRQVAGRMAVRRAATF